MKQEDQALTIKDVAKFLHLSHQMVYNLIKQKELKAFKIGSALRILYSDLMSYVQMKKTEFAEVHGDDDEFINTDDSVVMINDLCLQKGSFSLKDITFSFPRESILAILGASGSGKTLLLRSIAGLEHSSTGSVYFGKKRIDILAEKERRIGFVFQSYALFPHLSAKENIRFSLFSSKQKKAKQEEVIQALKELHLDSMYLPFKPEELPEGIKQLVAIGREKIRDVDLFCMDEPMSHLDKDRKQTMRILIKKILTQLKKTTLICVNDPLDALALSNYVVILVDGKVKTFGQTQTVYNNPQFPEVMDFFSCFGVNKFPVHIHNNEVSAFHMNTIKKDGDYTLYFRSEEIEIVSQDEGMEAEIIREHFIDGKTKLVDCMTPDDGEVNLVVPFEINEKFSFLPKNPLFAPVEEVK